VTASGDAIIHIATIPGVAAPIVGGTPVSAILIFIDYGGLLSVILAVELHGWFIDLSLEGYQKVKKHENSNYEAIKCRP